MWWRFVGSRPAARKHLIRSDQLDSLEKLGEHEGNNETSADKSEVDTNAHAPIRKSPLLDQRFGSKRARCDRVCEIATHRLQNVADLAGDF